MEFEFDPLSEEEKKITKTSALHARQGAAMRLSDRIECIVFAFDPRDSRRDDVRALAASDGLATTL